MRQVGEGFYTLDEAIMAGGGYVLQKRWVVEVRGHSYRYAGGATESPHEGPDYPWCGAATKEEAFRIGKAARLESIRRAEIAKRNKFKADMEELRKQRAALRALKLKECRVRGDNETYAEFKHNWDSDY